MASTSFEAGHPSFSTIRRAVISISMISHFSLYFDGVRAPPPVLIVTVIASPSRSLVCGLGGSETRPHALCPRWLSPPSAPPDATGACSRAAGGVRVAPGRKRVRPMPLPGIHRSFLLEPASVSVHLVQVVTTPPGSAPSACGSEPRVADCLQRGPQDAWVHVTHRRPSPRPRILIVHGFPVSAFRPRGSRTHKPGLVSSSRSWRTDRK